VGHDVAFAVLAARQRPKVSSARGPGFGLGQIASQHQCGDIGSEMRLVEAEQIIAADLLKRRFIADHHVPIGMQCTVEIAPHHLGRDARRLVAILEQRREPVGAHALDLVGGERRLQHDLGEDVEHRPCVALEHARAERAAIAAHVGAERGAQRLHVARDRQRIARLGAFVEHRQREARQSVHIADPRCCPRARQAAPSPAAARAIRRDRR
jgi:hypothetical protein